LNDEDVFILDSYTQLFVWIGSQSTQEEKEKAFAFTQQYVQEANDGRDPSVPIIRVTAGQEPSMFTRYFHGWDPEFTQKRIFKDPYQMKLDAIAAEKAKKAGADATPTPSAAAADASAGFLAPTPGAFSLAELKTALPNVDPARKEDYLSDAEFQSAFGMDRAAFKALAKWKRDDLKKKHGIF
jgi:advillin